MDFTRPASLHTGRDQTKECEYDARNHAAGSDDGPREIRFDRVPVPTAGPGQVLVKIKRIGICGSDIHVYHGKHPYTKYPVTQGHEVSGQVAALGRESPNSRWVSG